MQAIIQIGGNQYRVTPGTTLEVDRLDVKVGEVMSFPAIMVVDGQNQVKTGPEAAKINVAIKIGSHSKGDKIDVSRFRHKVRHRRHIGMRPLLTTVTVESIGEVKKEVKKPVAKKAVKTKTS